jgi:transcriptional regulator with XRE-family HTH domain
MNGRRYKSVVRARRYFRNLGDIGAVWLLRYRPCFRIKRAIVLIADRLRALRQQKKLSQGDIEKRSGLLRCYISRVENGHTVPAVETLEKLARAMDVPLYQLFYDIDGPPEISNVQEPETVDNAGWGSTAKEARLLSQFRALFGRMKEKDRLLLLSMAQRMVRSRLGRA